MIWEVCSEKIGRMKATKRASVGALFTAYVGRRINPETFRQENCWLLLAGSVRQEGFAEDAEAAVEVVLRFHATDILAAVAAQ